MKTMFVVPLLTMLAVPVERSHDNPAVWMEAVDPAEAKLLIASASLSNVHPKN
jgi:hypothetical protein